MHMKIGTYLKVKVIGQRSRSHVKSVKLPILTFFQFKVQATGPWSWPQGHEVKIKVKYSIFSFLSINDVKGESHKAKVKGHKVKVKILINSFLSIGYVKGQGQSSQGQVTRTRSNFFWGMITRLENQPIISHHSGILCSSTYVYNFLIIFFLFYRLTIFKFYIQSLTFFHFTIKKVLFPFYTVHIAHPPLTSDHDSSLSKIEERNSKCGCHVTSACYSAIEIRIDCYFLSCEQMECYRC